MNGKLRKLLSKKTFYVILALLIIGIIEVGYAATLINSKNVSYSNSSSKLNSNNVQGAIDELYNNCKNVKEECPTGKNCLKDEELPAYMRLKKSVVTLGDGLYQDSVEKDKYFYRGKNPNNFIRFNNELWRIININADGSIRIRRNESIGNYAFDTKDNGRYNSDSSYYCSNLAVSHGCAIWGAKNSTKDSNGNSLQSSIRLATDDTTYKLPDKEAYLNIYLNSTYYQTLSNKDLIKNDATYNIGPVRFEYTDYGQTIKTDISQSEKIKWLGKIALIEITDYPRTNSNQENCGSVMLNNDGSNRNYATCKNTTWIYNSSDQTQYSINKFSLNNSTWQTNDIDTWAILENGVNVNAGVNNEYPTYPVLTLKSSVSIISGSGKSSDPFIIK